MRKSPILRPALQATPPSSTDSKYCSAGNAGVGVNSSMGVWAAEGRGVSAVGNVREKLENMNQKNVYNERKENQRRIWLTFGPPKDKAKAFIVFLLKEHCLLLNDVVTELEWRAEGKGRGGRTETRRERGVELGRRWAILPERGLVVMQIRHFFFFSECGKTAIMHHIMKSHCSKWLENVRQKH